MRRWCFAINWLEDVTEGLLPHTAFRQLFLFIISLFRRRLLFCCRCGGAVIIIACNIIIIIAVVNIIIKIKFKKIIIM